ncbi:restriction endonuclease subunit S [Acinetobacter sp. XH1639]|uniref:restriction endonuclease subunit S n=1 Tax=Acinetobacter sp. XH1639 TaxID=3157368 RepID=UPI0032B4DA45
MAVPKLRFKEFDGDWTTSPLKALCKINQGLQIAIEDRFLEDGNNRYFYITNEFLKEGSKKAYFIENPPKAVICDESDILMTRTGNTGQVVTDVKGAFHNNFFKIDFDRSIINKNFFIEFLKKDTTQHLILKYAGASTIPDLNHSDFYRIVMPITTIEEQTKIASFLSAVDEKISQLTQKQQLLSQYKQGMMQKLFSQQIRFKADDGSEFGEWEEKALKTIARIYDGTHQTPNYVEDGVPFYSVEHVTANNFSKTKFIAENVFLDELKRVQLEKNDILLTRIGDIGTSKLIDWDVRASFYVSLALIKVDKNHNSSFVNQYIKSIFFQKELHERTIHVAFPKKINLGEIGLCLIRLPCLAEQTKIANFLSSIDQKNEVVAQQIEQAKQWKKGLLQQMFV